jgi:CheY-like chemotaxis protein
MGGESVADNQEQNETILEGKRVVVIDKHLNVSTGYKMLLEAYGASVTIFTSTYAFFESIRTVEVFPFDFVITDWIQAGEMDGLDLIRQIRNMGFNIPVILATTYDTSGLGTLSNEFKFTICSKFDLSTSLIQAAHEAFTQVEA